MQPNDDEIIKSFDDIIELMKKTSLKLKNKSQETEWQRYVFRRIPVYAGTAMMFFLIYLLMTTIKVMPFDQVSQLLGKLSQFTLSCSGIVLNLPLILLITWFTSKNHTRHKYRKALLSLGLKLVTTALFIWVISLENKSYSLITGIMLFGTATFSAMLADRTFGYTRRNERYDFFSKQAKMLAIKYDSLKAMPNSSFSEQHLNEYLAFFEQLRISKYNDTVSDSFYLLSQIERKLAG